MTLTLTDIDNAEDATKKVRHALQAIGREIYKMREGEELGTEYGFERYCRWEFDGPQYLGQEGPNWGVGTPIFSLYYYWSRGENAAYVTFPQSWLEQDWRALEQERLDKQRSEESERERIEAEKRASDREAAERKTFERLKAKFEGGAA
jgi:hypothetical protein